MFISKPVKPQRYIPQRPERILDAPDMVDDFYLNLLDWGSDNVLSIALGRTVFLWNASSGSISEGRYIAVGLNNSDVQIWDSDTDLMLRTLRGHRLCINSLAWNNHILAIGGMGVKVMNNDVRIREHIVGTYRGHQQEVCGLQRSASGKQLECEANDDLLFIWDSSMASSNSTNRRLYRLQDHTASVKALA